MILITYPHSKHSAEASYGWSEYSYRYLAEAFCRFLVTESIEYQIVHSLAELDAKGFKHRKEFGISAKHLSFAPPQAAHVSQFVDTIAFIAWEFPNFPEIDLGKNPRQNWKRYFESIESVFFMSGENVSAFASLGFKKKSFILPRNILHKFEALEDDSLESLSDLGSIEGIILKNDGSTYKDVKLVVRFFEWVAPMYRNFVKKYVNKHLHVNIVRVLRKAGLLESEAIEIPVGVEYSNLDILDPDIPTLSTWANIHDPRKNLDFIYSVVNEVSSLSGKSLNLILKIHGSEDDAVFAASEFDRISKLYTNSNVKIFVISKYLNRDEHLLVRKRVHIYLNASTGEGLCMPVIEHLSLGIPCVVPNNSAFMDYPESKYISKVEVDYVPAKFPQDTENSLNTYSRPPIRKFYVATLMKLLREIEPLGNSAVSEEILEVYSNWLNDQSANLSLLEEISAKP